MSLLRLAFWLGLIVLLLPTDAQQQERLSNFARAALERLTGFCDRNGRTCSVGGDVWSTFLRKAEFGVRLVGDLLGTGGRQAPGTGPYGPQGRPYGPQGPSAPQRPYGPQRGGQADPRGTLSPTDLYQPPWRGPVRPGGG